MSEPILKEYYTAVTGWEKEYNRRKGKEKQGGKKNIIGEEGRKNRVVKRT